MPQLSATKRNFHAKRHPIPKSCYLTSPEIGRPNWHTNEVAMPAHDFIDDLSPAIDTLETKQVLVFRPFQIFLLMKNEDCNESDST
jgi:hypothetical protein